MSYIHDAWWSRDTKGEPQGEYGTRPPTVSRSSGPLHRTSSPARWVAKTPATCQFLRVRTHTKQTTTTHTQATKSSRGERCARGRRAAQEHNHWLISRYAWQANNARRETTPTGLPHQQCVRPRQEGGNSQLLRGGEGRGAGDGRGRVWWENQHIWGLQHKAQDTGRVTRHKHQTDLVACHLPCTPAQVWVSRCPAPPTQPSAQSGQ